MALKAFIILTMAKKTQTQEMQNAANAKVDVPSHYVGIGASAGGLEALEEFFLNMPVSTGMSFIVVQHLSPDYKSMMVELLARKTKLEVIQIEDGMQVRPNCVYMVPPRKNLEIFHSQLILSEQPRDTGLNLPIDIFFRSLAADKGKQAIGIVLSGTGSDGSSGIRAIKEKGGLVIVQNYKNAKFDGMPKSAASTGLVDYLLDSSKMADAIVKYVHHPLVQQAANETRSDEETDFLKILSVLRTSIGEDFSYYKPKTIIRRIERRVSVNQMASVDEYINLLHNSPQECETLAKEFLIGVTQFFRDKEAFNTLKKKVIPELFKNNNGVNEPIRIWCVACSTGEEAYSLAILMKEYMLSKNMKADVKIFATDLDKESVRIASQALYTESIINDVPAEYLARYFIRKTDSYQLIDDIRQMVIFSGHNVVNDPPFSKINLLVCRNLLIYFKHDMQQKVLGLFQYALSTNGFLFLGSSESLNNNTVNFEAIDAKWKIFKILHKITADTITSVIDLQKIGVKNKPVRTQVTISKPQGPADSLYKKVINYFAPAGVIIDESNTVVHLFKEAYRFLVFPEGKPSYDIIEIANEQLKMVLSNMLYKVRKEQTEVVLKKVKYNEGAQNIYLNISAYPITDKNQRFIALIFAEQLADYGHEAKYIENDYNYNEQVNERIQELEKEVKYRDENLQTTIEELETSNEELQATNEELVSSNEELQSTNEELQSVNEELYTVNSQYQEKITELTTLNNDINNLLANTRIGTLYLDVDLLVRKFTPEITRVLNVLDVDIGRPVKHISLNCHYKNFFNDINSVIDNLEPIEREVMSYNRNWFLVKIQPYRHEDRSIHGVLITMVDITAFHQSKETFSKLFETMSQGVVYQDASGGIISVNPAAERILGMSRERMMELTSEAPEWKAIKENGEEFPGSQHPSMVALTTGKEVKNVVMGVFNSAKYRTTWININATPLIRPSEKKPYQVYTIFEDITVRKNSEKELRETIKDLVLSQKKYYMLFNSLNFGFAYHKIILDNNRKPVDYEFIKVNKAFEKLTGLKKEDIIGQTVKNVMPNIENYWIEKYGQVALECVTHEFEHESEVLNKRYKVSCYSPEVEYFVTLFEELKRP